MDIQTLLTQFKEGSLSLSEAEAALKNLPYEDLGFAKLDHHRQLRQGFGEVVFCSGKADEHLIKIYQTLCARSANVLGTRASQHQYELVREYIPEVTYDPISRILKYETAPAPRIGCIAVCTAGTADIPVAEEAAQTAEFFGSHVERYYDVGVAGIHRLLSKIETINQANCIIAIAGMEGALGSVLAGLADKPVIAVPTSVGYGANLGGISALLTMINSCANGITVVNIDNGYGAAYSATQINRLIAQGGNSTIHTPAAAPATKAEAPAPAAVTASPEKASQSAASNLWILETNIDDTTGEALGYVMEKLLEAGARDVFYTPIFMKKNRPAYLLRVLCSEKDQSAMERIIFTHTTTIGIRRYAVDRTALPRRIETVETTYGPAQIKICYFDGTEYAYPEHESVKAICEKTGLSYQQAYEEVQKAWKTN